MGRGGCYILAHWPLEDRESCSCGWHALSTCTECRACAKCLWHSTFLTIAHEVDTIHGWVYRQGHSGLEINVDSRPEAAGGQHCWGLRDSRARVLTTTPDCFSYDSCSKWRNTVVLKSGENRLKIFLTAVWKHWRSSQQLFRSLLHPNTAQQLVFLWVNTHHPKELVHPGRHSAAEESPSSYFIPIKIKD